MTAKKYRVSPTEEEQEKLRALVSRGRTAAYKQTHARILLLRHDNRTECPMMEQEITRTLKVGTVTVRGRAAARWRREWRRPSDARGNQTTAPGGWTARERSA